jgi:spore coat polysaccharide biosynthesis protein SpsF (cytidylyltransferase family)
MTDQNKKIVAITQARTGSTRLPKKVLLKVQDMSFLEIHLKRASSAKLVDEVIVATTVKDDDSVIADLASSLGYRVSRGPEDDVLERYYNAALAANAEVIVRITSDCPLIDPEIIDTIVEEHLKYSKDFTSNIITRTYPDGMDVEVFSMDALTKAWNEAKEMADREHVTYYIWKNSDLLGGKLFTAHNIVAENMVDFSNLRLTLDYPEDLVLITKLIELKGIDKSWMEYVDTLNENPSLIEINKYV